MSNRSRIALATCQRLPEPDHDQAPLLAALSAAGLDPFMSAWDDPAADLSTAAACIVRSTWNYYEEPERFLQWVETAETATLLLNPAAAIRKNVNKRYLLDYAEAGLPTVPTLLAGPDPKRALAEVEARGWRSIVIKPAVSAGSFQTRRFRRTDEAAAEFLASLDPSRDVLIQPYIDGVDSERGERAIVWIDGACTHAVRKQPRFHGEDEEVTLATAPSRQEAALMEEALAQVAPGLLYARMDVLPGPGGELLIGELELIEPSLFLLQHPPALLRFVGAIQERAR